MKTKRFKAPKYVGDPINAVRIFNEKEVDELIFLDITATIEHCSPNFDLIAEVAGECFMPLAYGGGVRSMSDARRILKSGVEKIIFNTVAHTDPNVISQASREFGAQAVVISMDVRRKLFGRYEVFVKSGTSSTGHCPESYAKRMQDLGAGEIFLNSIDKDGSMTGYDLDLIERVSNSVNIPVIACGGAGSKDDFQSAAAAGASAMAAGSMFVFHGPHKAVLITYQPF